MRYKKIKSVRQIGTRTPSIGVEGLPDHDVPPYWTKNK